MFANEVKQSQYLQQVASTGIAGASTPAPTPMTLVRAISRAEELNGRLGDLERAVQEIATAIGGPRPCNPGSGEKGPPAPPPAMTMLNDSIDLAHFRVTEIEDAVSAIRRTLGG